MYGTKNAPGEMEWPSATHRQRHQEANGKKAAREKKKKKDEKKNHELEMKNY